MQAVVAQPLMSVAKMRWSHDGTGAPGRAVAPNKMTAARRPADKSSLLTKVKDTTAWLL
jgi:hypothetical protein